MDTSSIAAMITQVLHRYLTNSPDSPEQTAGQGQQEGIAEKAKGLYEMVKNKLSSHPESAQTLQAFEQAPEQHAEEMQGALTQHLSNDPGFLAQTTDHLAQIKPSTAGGSLVDKAKGMISGLLGEQKDEPGAKAA